MISRLQKQIFYTVAGPFMAANGILYKLFRAPNQGLVKVHLGPGQNNYLDEWINIDANIFTAKCDVWGDLRNSLPFKDESVDIFYSHHVIEHLPNLDHHFKEMYRCLKIGGKVRIGGPNGDSAIQKFLANDLNWFGDFPDKRISIGGRFENFIFCRQEHLTILTCSYLQELAENVGLVNFSICKPVLETHFPELIDNAVLSKEWESDYDFPHTLIIEAEKK